MEFDETLFAATMSAVADEQRSSGHADNSSNLVQGEGDTVMKTGNQKVHKQTFYPTPNSSNMHATSNEKQFMSPFPTNYQGYVNNMNVETSFAELDELLFTPMLSPAMTPAQQYHGRQPQTEVDWDNFDRNIFALTGSAIETMDPQAFNMVSEVTQPSKKQRTSTTSSKTSRQTSPTNAFSNKSRPASTYAHKRNNSMAAPARPASDKDSSLEASDEFSPVDLDHFNSTDSSTFPSQSNLSNSTHIQPITPSMLMSLQSTSHGHEDSQGLLGTVNELQMSEMTPAGSLSTATTPVLPAFPMPQPSTPRSNASAAAARDVRSRPIAPAHSKSKSVTSSPALGPQRCRPSPDIRPILPGGMSPQVGAMLASKSNYQHIVDGTYDQLNITYPQGMTHGLEVRRTSHKAAEQKRRDHLKECFELLRTILPDRPEPGASKVAILKKGYEHILQLQAILKEKDAKIASLEGKVQ